MAGGGTGIEISGGGIGSENLLITLPAGIGLEMEIILGCDTATISVLDSANLSEIATFYDIKVVGDTGLCQSDANEFRGKYNRGNSKKF